MSGLAELARRRKELEELFAFVEDIEYPGGLAAASIEAGLGDPTEWIRPLRDTIAAITVGSALCLCVSSKRRSSTSTDGTGETHFSHWQ